ncbi:phenylalanyl-tRNA synthetase beta chain [Rhizomicrobium palustre]|uniref:Phenylalanine--tRNA ligase beta subunit n=1 Tax=Rhizomicrobium palustre TaxID=189966 RepID=A0A846MXV1_9PROT|nr:phenylalanine--tRNA ligase subunit beta [Rhizomicrobium palustre]NIK88206.1 phenylalanyl-tRNA synthetase beta chain [Rhizomicrobium palustre]
MKFPLSWLKDHLETDADAATIAEKLTSIGLEVESVEDAGARLKDFTVAYVVSAEKHPNADRLRLCMVDAGGKEPVQVVCGAPNARTGIKVVFAQPGTVVPVTGEALKIGTIRGVESRGMMCSGRELLLSDDHDGIIELPESAVVGEKVAEVLGLNDPVIDISITPNRGDCTSVWGVARDLAAAGLGRLKTPVVETVKGKFPSPKTVSLQFDGKPACPLFAGRFIKGVKNGPSPKWVQDRLKSIGLRPINALVDVTNLIAHDRGRPLHVFDADKLVGNVSARLAKDGEELLALDGKTYKLDAEMCVIADEAAARGIAGVMGGEETGCTETTTNVFLESAYFVPVSVASTGRKLQLNSDARYRFERGVDPEFVIPGIELATRLILDWCGGEASEVVVAGEVPEWKREIVFTPAMVKRIGGLDVEEKKIVEILTHLGFGVTEIDGTTMKVVPPSWRSDIDGAADLVEEVVRIFGLEHVQSVPMERPDAIARPVLTSAQKRRRIIRRAIAARGFNEAVSFSFIPRAHAALFGGGDDARQIANPIAADMDALRPTPLPSLLAAAQRNQARGVNDLMLFEIGAGFQSGVPGAQQTIVAGLRIGNGPRNWSKSTHPADAFDVKADVLAALEAAMGAAMNAPIKAGAPGWYHPGRSGTLALGPKVLATFGELHPKIVAAFDLSGPVAAFELILDHVPDSKSKRTSFSASPYQAVERDFAFVVDVKVAAEDVVKAAKNAERVLIEAVSLFDVYEGKGVPEGKKSLAISVRLQPKDKTLTDPEIEGVAQKIVAAVAKATGGTLRA